MKPPVITILTALFFTAASAQNIPGIYGITGNTPGDASWTSIQSFNARLGQPTLLLNNELQGPGNEKVNGYKKALCSGTAATAFDAATGRLFYVTMIKGDIRYMNVEAPEAAAVQVQNAYKHFALPAQVVPGPNEQGAIVTRLAHNADKYIYGLSNNAQYFFRFAPDAPQKVEVLGAIADAPKNGAFSIHEQAIGWGGDMVPDHKGNFYVYAVSGHVFYLHTAQRQAAYIGKLMLPEGFTVSGAAALEDGSVMLSSSAGKGSYLVLEDAGALTYNVYTGSYNTSDLASSFFAGKPTAAPEAAKAKLEMQVAPNPIQGGIIRLNIAQGLQAGNYECAITDAAGRRAAVAGFKAAQGQTQVTIPAGNLAKGMYQMQVHGASMAAPQVVRIWIQ